jgi:hypothetical protein
MHSSDAGATGYKWECQAIAATSTDAPTLSTTDGAVAAVGTGNSHIIGGRVTLASTTTTRVYESTVAK